MSATDRPRGPVDPRLLRHARPARAGIAGIGVVEAAGAGALVLQAVALADVVVSLWHRTDPAAGLRLLLVAVAARVLTSWSATRLAQRTASAVRDDLRIRVLDRSLRLGPAWVERFGRGRLAALLTQGLPSLDGWFTRYLPALVPGVLLPPVVLLLLALTDLESAVTVLVTLPLVPVFAVLLGKATQVRADRQWRTQRTLAAHFLDTVRGLPTLRAHRRAQRQVAAVAATTDAHRRATLSVLRVAFLSSTALDLVGTLSVGLVAVTAGMRLAGGSLDLHTAVLVILLAPEAYRPLREVGARFHDTADATAVVDDVDAVLSAPLPEHVVARTAGIRLRGVTVRREDGTAVVAGVDLDVVPGELHALAGPSGAGKTTVARVAAGVLVPDAGAVALAPSVAHLPQRPEFGHAVTAADAVRAGREATDEQVRSALAEVAAADLDPTTPLGEHAAGLSAGQRQRVALARTVLSARLGARVLILDEPTAHLDPAAEATVVATLRSLAHDDGLAVLVVAHRPALLAAVDRTTPLARPLPPAPVPRVEDTPSAPPGRSEGAEVVLSAANPPPRGRWAGALAVATGVVAVLAGLTLTAAATWLLVTAADRPPVLTLSVAAVVVRASATARPLLVYAERLLSHDVAFARLARWRSDVVAALVPRLPGPLSRKRSGRSGELLVQLADDVDARVDGVLRARHPATVTVVAVLLALAALTALHPLLALAAVPGVLVAVVGAPAVAAAAERREGVDGDAHRAGTGALSAATVEVLDAVEDLQTLPADQALDTLRRRQSVVAVADRRRARAAAATAGLTAAGAGLVALGTAAVAGRLVGTADAPVAWTAAAVLAGVVLADAARGLPDAARAAVRARRARERETALLDTPVPAVEPTTPRALASPSPTVLSLRGVRADWGPTAVDPCLDLVDLELRAGEVVAVRGPSGSGKSTLAAVLQRFLDPTDGQVLLDGVDVTDLAGDDVRSVVGRVGDDEHVFATSVRQNLLLAAPDRSDDDLLAVLDRVRLDEWFRALPRGLESRVGDGGSPMSGGERRRLAMARALLADVRVLVLDEPSEGLDVETGRQLVADLLEARSGRTVLLLAHRDEGVDRADRVLDLRDGKLVPAPEVTRSAHGSGFITGSSVVNL
ncbi:thiol reductant ABC exporter subunit CydD [Kineococcus sp. DHX-1]|uniref:thiol reductant ABC exporter subunit CydD n=1 Tax=Kineococcus sp. DHX-1 TaxID=3349638 RepID=UPI0036D43763